MPKYSINQKSDMLSRSYDAERKAKRYSNEASAYKIAEKTSTGMLKDHYTAEKEAKNQIANMYEQEAEMLKERAANSRAQYEHEKAQGGAMTDLSYEDWKKL